MRASSHLRHHGGENALPTLYRPHRQDLVAGLLVLTSFVVLGVLLGVVLFTTVAVPAL